MTWIGIGYRSELANWIRARPAEIQCVEITAEHFFDGGDDVIRDLTREYAVFVHGLGLSLGTDGPVDQNRLDQFARVVKLAEPEWISEHVAFTHSNEVDLGHLNPVRPTRESLLVIAGHAREVAERCGRPVLLENITSYMQLTGEMTEPEFLNRLCEEAHCGILLDVTNLYINSRNHGFDPIEWLHEIDPKLIIQLHAVGYTQSGGVWHDYHAEAIQDDLLDLIHEVVAYAPVRAITLERDGNFPSPDELVSELRLLERACALHDLHRRPGTSSH